VSNTISLALALSVILMAPAAAQEENYSALLRRCVRNEAAAMQQPPRFQFVEHIQQTWGSETRAVIETGDGRVDRVIAFNDHPLTADQQRKEQQRLLELLKDPEAWRKEFSDQRDESRRRELMIEAMPQAFLLTFLAAESDGNWRFSFSPNPEFSAKSRETQVFKGMRGLLWIDPKRERLVRVQGQLFKDVNFGWHILGRLNKGGSFEIVQTQVTPGVWRITTLNLDFKGRELLFGHLRVFQKVSSTQFVAISPAMKVEDAVAQLLSQPELPIQSRYPQGFEIERRNRVAGCKCTRLIGRRWLR
jgi:hypothetical protein